jgi:uncharacterized membrane protein YfcA
MDYIFLLLLPLCAFLYASVGHGGASAYLALMSLWAFSPDEIRPTALVLNILVSGIAFIQFYRAGHFKFKLFGLFAASSIPLSFLGGMTHVSDAVFRILLGAFLVLAALRIFLYFNKKVEVKPAAVAPALIIGGVIGYLSGLIGIGGGIILSPVLLLLAWANAREAAAVSALFILVNSISGLSGQLISGITVSEDIWLYVLLAACGGIVGAYLGSKKLKLKELNIILAIVLAFAGVKLLLM